MINVKNISKVYYKKKNKIIALDNFSYDFEKYKLYAIMGASGSGKSTLLNIIGLLDKPTSGFIFYNKKNTKNYTEKEIISFRAKKIGYIFQEFYLNNNLNVFENVMIPLLINKSLESKSKRIIANELLKKVGLEDRKLHFPNELSGEERQRGVIARALTNNPEIILADEPTGNLDEETEKEIFELFKKLRNEGKCIVVASHSINIKKYVDDIIYINKGKIRGVDKNAI